jgi:hypothetical protein
MTFKAGLIGSILLSGIALAASLPDVGGTQAKMVITVVPEGSREQTPQLQMGDVTVERRNVPVHVTRLERLPADLADVQLFVVLDDSTRSTSLGLQIPELRTFIQSLPASTQVAVGYMRNGSVVTAQAFTTDHEAAARAVRLPMAVPGINGSPYFALTDLAKHWPSKDASGRRALLMLSDGVDRYWGSRMQEDPYVDDAIRAVLKQNIMAYAIYLRGAGAFERGGWGTTVAQGRLMEVTDQTGGYSYFEGTSDPVTIAPFLNNFRDRLENQYALTMETAAKPKGVDTVKVRSNSPGLKVEGPTRIYLP